MKTNLNIREEPNKCNQCDNASSESDFLRTHLKVHSGEKTNKCNQWDFVSLWANALTKHIKRHIKVLYRNRLIYATNYIHIDIVMHTDTFVDQAKFFSTTTRSFDHVEIRPVITSGVPPNALTPRPLLHHLASSISSSGTSLSLSTTSSALSY